MILSIGEILADIFFDQNDGKMTAKLGGAPFNMAVSASRSGAKVSFLGRVGADPLGKWLIAEAKKYGLDSLNVQEDPLHDTTIAMVTVKDGERDFQFLRKFSADYYLDVKKDDVKADIVHVGSLMLSEKRGVKTANAIFDYAQNAGILTSFDVNYRSDIFPTAKQAVDAYKPFIERANILKFSEEEITLFTGLSPQEGIKTFKNKLVCVTLGENGSIAYKDGVLVSCPTNKVKPVDTTGAGDAFYGAFVAGVDKIGYDDLTKDSIYQILKDANEKGAKATTFVGAIRL